MAWTCQGIDNESMVAALAKNLGTSMRTQEAMRAVDRGLFATHKPYQDAPQRIGSGATISAPHMHAYCLDLLADHLLPGAQVLDVGSGSGYLTAAMAHMACTSSSVGRVVGVEHIPELLEQSLCSLQRIPWAAQLMDTGRLQLIEGDGQQGCQEHAPYDVIHVGAAAAKVPAALIEQLRPGGRLLIPVGEENGAQTLVVVDKHKTSGAVHQHDAMPVAYVPLTTREHQLSRAAMFN